MFLISIEKTRSDSHVTIFRSMQVVSDVYQLIETKDKEGKQKFSAELITEAQTSSDVKLLTEIQKLIHKVRG